MKYLRIVLQYIRQHKFISGIIGVGILSTAGYLFFSQSTDALTYVVGEVKKRDILIAVTGTGQILPEQQIDLKPKTSGEIVFLSSKNGVRVEKGDIIARVDATDQIASVRDARNSYETSRLSYEKFLYQNTPEKLEANRIKAYDDAYRALSEYFADIPKVVNQLEDILVGDPFSLNLVRLHGGDRGVNMKERAEATYYAADAKVDGIMRQYRTITRTSDRKDVDVAMKEAYASVVVVSDAVKAFRDLADYLYGESGNSTTYGLIQTTLLGQAKTTSDRSADLLAVLTKIQDAEDTMHDALYDEKSSALSLKDREHAVSDAESKLADYTLRAPFSGILSLSDIHIGDSVSNSTVVGTLMSEHVVAEISLNEVDAAKVVVGQKATVTFDAIEKLVLVGSVVEMDVSGTESQGVVTYNAKIGFEQTDERIKPGMTVSAEVEVEKREHVLAVSASSIKKQAGVFSVETLDMQENITPSQKPVVLQFLPARTPVTVGLSNDEYTEIIDGLNEGQLYVIRTVTPSTAQVAGGSGVRMPGMPTSNTRSR